MKIELFCDMISNKHKTPHVLIILVVNQTICLPGYHISYALSVCGMRDLFATRCLPFAHAKRAFRPTRLVVN